MFGLCEGAVLPILALSARALGLGLAQSGLVVALMGIGALLANLPAAWLTTRYGERRALLGATAVVFLGLCLCLWASHWAALSGGVLLIGIARAVFMLARQAFLVEHTPAALRARAMAMLGGVHRIGMFVGPFLGAACIYRLGLAGGYWAALGVMLITGVLAWYLPELDSPAPPLASPSPATAPTSSTSSTSAGALPLSWRAMLRAHQRVLLTLGLAASLVAAIRAGRQVILPLWASHIGLDAADTSLIYGWMGALDMALFYPAGKWMDQRGRLFVTLPSLVLMGSSLLLMPWTQGFTSLLLVGLLLGMGNGIGTGIVLTVGADAAPAVGRTQFLGLWRFLIDLGNGGGPLLIAVCTSLTTLATGITVMGGLGFVAAWMFWRWLPREET